MAKERENVKIYDAETATFRAPKAADKDKVAEHEAIAAGEPLPGDRTAEELARLEPGMGGSPVLTAGPEGSAATAGVGGAGAGAARPAGGAAGARIP